MPSFSIKQSFYDTSCNLGDLRNLYDYHYLDCKYSLSAWPQYFMESKILSIIKHYYFIIHQERKKMLPKKSWHY